MKLHFVIITILCFLISANAAERKLVYQPFDTVTVYTKDSTGTELVLFISGDGGWNQGVVTMARTISSLGATVVGIDIVKYMKKLNASHEKCVYPAEDFELLSKFIQQTLHYPRYCTPVLIGYSSGATLAYVLIAQAPAGTFKGAISMGFCPDLPLTIPPCSGSGLKHVPGPKGKGYSFLPNKELSTPWIAFQGAIDEVCPADTVTSFVKLTGNAQEILLPKVGHGFSVEKNWLPQFKQAYSSILNKGDSITPREVASSVGGVEGLPLVEVPAVTGKSGKMFAIILSGDGGWAGIDRALADAFTEDGIPVVGWNSLNYYWKKRTPEEAARDLERIIVHYQSLWKRDSVLLVGYSFGADVLPFLANRISSQVSEKVTKLAFLGLSDKADFQFHVSGWLGGASDGSLPVLPEIKKLSGKNMIYLYGADEKESVAKEIDRTIVKVVELPGGHHFNGHYQTIAQTILGSGMKAE
jgi:type IV secretory pathway VirJ component